MEPCDKRGAFGRLACSFEPRFDITPPSMDDLRPIDTTVGGAISIVEALTKRIYVRDVCTACGKTVERHQRESGL